MSCAKQWAKRVVGDWRLGLLIVASSSLILLMAQLPFTYTFIAGKERGAFSDQPFLQQVHAAEANDDWGRWRWMRSQSLIDVPGIGQRSVILRFRVVSHRAQRQPDAPPTILQMQSGNGPVVPLTLRLEGARYHVLLPAATLDDGRLNLHLTTESWQNEGDRRGDLGIAIGEAVSLQSVPSSGLVIPPLSLMLAWVISLVLLWVTLRVLAFTPVTTWWLLLPLALGVPWLLLYEAPRLAFGTFWVIQASLIALVSALLSVLLVPPFLRALLWVPPPQLLRWLLLLLVLSFVLKFGARLYPEAMPGDLQLHVNRYSHTVLGQVYILAQHRGLPFPFPNALYIVMAPLTLLPISIHVLFEVLGGLFEATTVLLLYLMVTRATGHARWGVLSAALYALTAGGFMNSWFAFETQIAGQWVTLLLILLLVWHWPQYQQWLLLGGLVMLFIQVFLGHIGQAINTTLVGILLIPLLWWQARTRHEQHGVRWLLLIGLIAGVFVALFYYSAFWGTMMEMLQIAQSGLNNATGRRPIPREETLQVLWYGGLITHFGFFPVLLAVAGALLMLQNQRMRRSLLVWLIWLSFAVSLSQALLPLITLNSITTRWLMFSAWAIAISGALGWLHLWSRGRAARIVTWAMAGYICWLTLSLWAAAMAWRLPPIEPF
ncbi:MAG: hypothetical protein HC837_05000 [Chloroflexaceae bacterium]|nr:hypothetical protein [Chloroflexaceae bacterium]